MNPNQDIHQANQRFLKTEDPLFWENGASTLRAVTADSDDDLLDEEDLRELREMRAQLAEIPDASQSTLSTQQTPDKWEASGHDAIGTNAFREYIAGESELSKVFRNSGLYSVVDEKFTVADHINLTAGQIVALGGDFYGVPDKPICFAKGATEERLQKNRMRRFEAAYASLEKAPSNEVKDLIGIIAGEKEIIQKAFKAGKKPNIALKSGDLSRNFHYSRISRYTFFPYPFLFNRYADLAVMNFDHFMDEARIAYAAGHAVALKTAAKAGRDNDIKGLIRAFCQELFACHFLTDLFASGHMRTPRKALMDYVEAYRLRGGLPIKGAGIVAGFLAKKMHDEDNQRGLRVENDYAEWDAYGDKCFYNDDNENNAAQAQQAVISSLKEVHRVYGGEEPTNDYLAWLPKILDEENDLPLFVVEDGVLKLRDEDGHGHSPNWNPVTTFYRLLRGQHQLTPEEEAELQQEVNEIVEEENALVVQQPAVANEVPEEKPGRRVSCRIL